MANQESEIHQIFMNVNMEITEPERFMEDLQNLTKKENKWKSSTIFKPNKKK
jgi:hypothetical protein